MIVVFYACKLSNETVSIMEILSHRKDPPRVNKTLLKGEHNEKENNRTDEEREKVLLSYR